LVIDPGDEAVKGYDDVKERAQAAVVTPRPDARRVAHLQIGWPHARFPRIRKAADGFLRRMQRRRRQTTSDEQERNLRVTACVFSVFGIAGVVLLFREFSNQLDSAASLLIGATIALYVAWLTTAIVNGRKRWFLGLSLVFLVALGSLWGGLIESIARVATGSQANFVVLVAMSMVSTPMLGSPLSIALAFWTPAAFGAAFAVGWALKPEDSVLGVSFICFEAFTLVGTVFINWILSEKSRVQAALEMRNATVGLLLRDYEENASDWLWETDRNNLLRGITTRFAQVLGQPGAEQEGKSLVSALGLDRTESQKAQNLIRAIARKEKFQDLPVDLVVAGEERWWSLSGRPVFNASGLFTGYRGVGSDITEAKRADEAARYLATHDMLTRIGNRHLFHERMAQACAADPHRHGSDPFALLLIDLDAFKAVNDNHGHEVGDQVLVVVADRMRHGTRPGDTIARLGGDEFAIIMPSMGQREAVARAEKLIASVSERIRVDDAWLGVGASIGIVVFPEHGLETAELSRNADLALYRAKEAGKGKAQLFQSSFSEEYQDRAILLADLRLAIDNGGLSAWFQPIVDIASGKTVSMEALCRWQHPERGFVPPSVFIPLAEESGLISRLGQQMLERACLEAMRWEPEVGVSVNLSPLQLKDPNLADTVAAILRHTGLGPHRLELEVTESTWLRGDDHSRRELARLEGLGAKIVLDDFGTGYSSLSTLHSFRFQGLKIDAEFTRDLERDPKAGAIIRLVAGLAAELGITLTAEGIETAGQLETIRSFGIPRAQGYLFGRPYPAPAGRPSVLGVMTGDDIA